MNAGAATAGVACGLAAMLLMPARSEGRLERLQPTAPWTPLRGPVGVWFVSLRDGLRGRIRRRLVAEATAAAVVELADAVAAELGAGRSALAALGLGCSGVEDAVLSRAVRPVAETLPLGGDPAGALARASTAPGCHGLRWLAVAWQVTESSGAGLAATVERIAAVGRAEADHRREVRAQLAGPRATALLLAGLPVVGIALGAALGADPLAVLVGTPGGAACLVVGLALEVAGLRWTARLAAAAERSA